MTFVSKHLPSSFQQMILPTDRLLSLIVSEIFINIFLFWLVVEGECLVSRQLAASIVACCFLGLFPTSANFSANFDEVFNNMDRYFIAQFRH